MYKNIKIRLNNDSATFEQIQKHLFSKGNVWSGGLECTVVDFITKCLYIDNNGVITQSSLESDFYSLQHSKMKEFEVLTDITLTEVIRKTITIEDELYYLDDVVKLLKLNKIETISDILTPYGKLLQNAKTIVKDDIIGKHFDCRIQGVYVHGRIYEDPVYPESIVLGFLPPNSDIGWRLDFRIYSATLEDGYTHGWRLKKDLSNLEMNNVTDLKFYVW